VSDSTKEKTVTILDLGARKPVATDVPFWLAHMRLAQFQQENPHRRYTLTGVRHG
jgi:hypothetical protein